MAGGVAGGWGHAPTEAIGEDVRATAHRGKRAVSSPRWERCPASLVDQPVEQVDVLESLTQATKHQITCRMTTSYLSLERIGCPSHSPRRSWDEKCHHHCQ